MARIPIAYDPAVIQEFAGRLYSQSSSIIFTSTLLGLIIGTLIGLGLAGAVQDDEAVGIFLLVGLMVGGFFGYIRGKERSFKLRLEAQIALCQVEIERHTRDRSGG